MSPRTSRLRSIGRWLKRGIFLVGALNVGLALLGTFVWLGHGTRVKDGSVLHLTLDGAMREGPLGPVAALAGAKQPDDLLALATKLRAAAVDPRIVGLFVEVKEPQVGPAQLLELARAVKAFHDSDKPSWSFLETAGEGARGDGAYALAAMANTIMLAPSGEIALYGSRADVPFVKEALARVKVDVSVEQRYEYKSFADTFAQSGFTAAHRASLTSLLTSLQDNYCALVAGQRHRKDEEVRSWILQSPHSAESARAAGLVDDIGYRAAIIERLQTLTGRKEPLVAIDAYVPRQAKKTTERVALVTGSGEIARGEGSRTAFGDSEGIGSDTFVEALKQAREDEVDAIVVRLNTPGGSYLASDLIRHELTLAREQNIPVVVTMGDVAASGGYHVASAADYIVAEASTLTGSIGVLGVSFALRRALDHFFGIHFGSLAVLPHPGVLSNLDPPDAEDTKVFARSIDRIYLDFVDKVAKGRGHSFDEIHAVAKGRVWTGQQALEHKLVDELGGYEAALAYVRRRLELPAQAPLTLIDYPEPSSAWTLLRDAVSGQVRLGHLALAAGPLMHLAHEAIQAGLPLVTSGPQARMP